MRRTSIKFPWEQFESIPFGVGVNKGVEPCRDATCSTHAPVEQYAEAVELKSCSENGTRCICGVFPASNPDDFEHSQMEKWDSQLIDTIVLGL